MEGIRAVDPVTGESFGSAFPATDLIGIGDACACAAAAFDTYRATEPEARARFLETIGEEIAALGDALVTTAMRETALPRGRLESERARTIGQLRLFASLVRSGEWLELRINSARPERAPLPRPDIRLRHIPLGPVAVFGASNFPLAFSVAGGDTAAALAAGCPVVVKAHNAHPGTSALVADAVQRAVRACAVPEHVFTLIFGAGNETGAALVADPHIAAVGFTGSRAGGFALIKIAAARPVPIPVYAEMSSVNPILLLPAALAARGTELASGFVASLTLGAGQFCTNPGLIFAVASPALNTFITAARNATHAVPAATMLTHGIGRAYCAGVERLSRHPHVRAIAEGRAGTGAEAGKPALFETDAANFRADPTLADEVFGPTGLIIRCSSDEEIAELLMNLEGQLTVTLHMDSDDISIAQRLLPILERKAGRILANGWPTGVEVCDAMVHGGPFPATTDGRTTSVGTLAVRRFLRPVSYQNLFDKLRPPELRDGNPYALPRRVDGEWEMPPAR